MLIRTQKALNTFCDALSSKPFITVDTEFLREKTYYPKLCLIQLSDPAGNAAAIDPLEGKLNLAPVYDLLSSKDILKIFHAGRQDLEIFYRLTGKVVEPFFDTQIAAMVCGYGDSVGYESLVRNLTEHTLDKSVQFTNWSHRPLSERQIEYALGDVIYLVEIYKHLSKELEKRGRTSWVYQEEEILADPATYENPPDEAWQKIRIRSPKPKNLAVLKALAAWREERAQAKDLPRHWVLRDDTLADIAGQIPTTVANLKKIRNMPPDQATGTIGAELLAIIEEVLIQNPKTWPKPQKKKPLSPSTAATADVLRMLLKVNCLDHDVATKIVASKEDVETIAQEDDPDVPAMKGWRHEVFGADALALKKGELAIGLKGSKITKYRVSKETENY